MAALVAGFLTGTGYCQATAVPASTRPEAAQPVTLASEAALQGRVTIDAVNRPLGDLFAELSLQTGAVLTVDRDLRDQRVNVSVSEQPLYRVMERLTELLSHTPDAPRGYFWEASVTPGGPRPRYVLRRDARARRDEQNALDFPRKEAFGLLRTFREALSLSAKAQQDRDKTLPRVWYDSPGGIFAVNRRIFHALTDAQMGALARGETIPLDNDRFAPERTLYLENRDVLEAQQFALPLENRSSFPPLTEPTLRLGPAFLGDCLPGSEGYLIKVEGLAYPGDDADLTHYLTLDGFVSAAKPDVFTPDAASDEILDLAPILNAESVTEAQRADLGFTLHALAQAAKVNLYEEHFFTLNREGVPSRGLPQTKGTLSELINGICQEWQCHAAKSGGDYFVWRRAWAQDRTRDISDRWLAPWRNRLSRRGFLTTDDRAAMSADLTLMQMAVTLPFVLPETKPLIFKTDWQALRVWQLLSPGERDRLRQEPLPLADLFPARRATFLRTIEANESDLTDNAYLVLESDNKSKPGTFPGSLILKSGDGTTLWQGAIRD